MYIHDIIKILYINLGYLPNYPYYLISDKEMFEAFLKEGDGVLADYYPCPDEMLQEQYDALMDCIKTKIQDFMDKKITELPCWVYSYMLLQTTSVHSSEEDISYLYELSNIVSPTILATFEPQIADVCYEVSKRWLQKSPSGKLDRVPTMFGEPHVIKSMRLDQANVLLDPTGGS